MRRIVVSEEQRANLLTLSNFLKSHNPPPKFDMYSFMRVRNNELEMGEEAYLVTPEVYTRCGTTACAVGHGPLAGIPVLNYEKWSEYASRAFGARLDDYPGEPNGILFGYLFGMDWRETDNTPEGAAARIDYYLKNGGVDDNWREQLDGNAPLTYKETI